MRELRRVHGECGGGVCVVVLAVVLVALVIVWVVSGGCWCFGRQLVNLAYLNTFGLGRHCSRLGQGVVVAGGVFGSSGGGL